MPKKLSYKQYQRVFGGPGMPFITSFMFVYYYRQIDFLVTVKDNLWTAYLKKNIFKKTLTDGVKFYRNNRRLTVFKKTYRQHLKESIHFFKATIRKKNLTKPEVQKFFNYAGEVLSLYVKCEFFFTDQAFVAAKHDKKLAKNLSDFDKLKNPGKEQIIRVFFAADSYIYRLLKILAKQLDVPFDDLLNYQPQEILDLFVSKTLNKKVIQERKNFYILRSSRAGVEILTDIKYKAIIDKLAPKIKPQKVLRGTIANRGKVVGRVKLFNHGYEFYKVSQLIAEMKKGDILVTETTSPELLPACKKAKAIVTNEGGLLSHAAIISRELNIPCIVGAHGITSSVKDGDMVEVDANKGIVRKIK